MELTLDQALQKGMEAHKSGEAKEADRYYTAILKANPKHPDANHNMGVLAVGVGKVEAALPFFKTALEANPNIAQYWLSYIEALIKLNRASDAKAVLDQAKNKGDRWDGFNQLEEKLSKLNQYYDSEYSNTKDPSGERTQQIIILFKQGQYHAALNSTSVLLLEFPNSAILYNILGAANKGLGKIEQAIDAYEKALEINPLYIDAYNNIGNALKEKGNHLEALEAYRNATLIKPNYSVAHFNMGNTFQDLGRLEDAVKAYKKAIEINNKYSEAYNNLGVALRDQGKLEGAIEAYRNALFMRPDYADALNNKGNALHEKGDFISAIKNYKKALSFKPDYADAYYNIGNALKDIGSIEEALEAYDKAIQINPEYADAYNNMGNILQDIGNIEEALEAYDKAIQINPEYADAYNNMGNALKDKGELYQAIAAYEKAIIINPLFADAHRNLSNIKKYKIDDPHFEQVKELYSSETLLLDDKCCLDFALAKMFDDVGSIERAFRHLERGNAIRKKLLNYCIDEDKHIFKKLKEVSRKIKKYEIVSKNISKELIPLFIVGLPRSGTTLVEQIISSHSEVTGAGELNYMFQYGSALSTALKTPSQHNILNVREMYLAELSKLSQDNRFVTDKMPQNFRFIPLICAAMPEAKIIHVQRDSTATCWSNYKQYFVSKNIGYCYSLRDVVAYYNLYKDLIDFYQSDYNDRIYNLNYEKLTTDQENQTRELISHLGLNWEEACLSPQRNMRSVRTASQQQVRQRVYQRSSEAWRKYKPYLNGAFDSLKSM